MKNNRLKVVTRAPGLVETNSSSSHTVSICMDDSTNLKIGDPAFDLDIRDGVLYIPTRDEEFGWQYEKSNSCQTKLQYVCAFYFNSYEPLYLQKRQKKLENILKRILGVKAVVFQWVEQYISEYDALKKANPNRRISPDEIGLGSPCINHNSYSDMKEQILESEDTIKNFILNPKSWWYGGNDNSDAPEGFYEESIIENPDQPEAVVTVDFGGELGEIDFIAYSFPGSSEGGYSFYDDLRNVEENRFIDDITWNPDKKEFSLEPTWTKSGWKPQDFLIIGESLYLYYFSRSMEEGLICKSDSGTIYKTPEELIKSGNYTEGVDYILLRAKLWTDEFGYIFQ